MGLEGQHVVVTGAGGGIGSVVARSLAASKTAVSCWDRNQGQLSALRADVAQQGYRMLDIACDVSDIEEVEQALAKSEAELGPVTGLVATAGGAAGERIPFLELDAGSWQRMLTRNLTTAFSSSLVVGRAMAARRRGSIVLFGSQAATAAAPGLAAYAAAKGAIRQLARSVALELAPYGVRVNVISPGIVETAANRSHITAGESALVDRIPLGRAGQPEELTGAINYLLSEDASFTTGAWIDIDGGYTLI
jgi:NAD(P)-dependent dehydrogenase (short-subunit alcohol dehydrogenase family)